MRNAVSILSLALLVGYVGYDNRQMLADEAKFLFSNPAEKVLNANLEEKTTIFIYEHEVFGRAILYAGTEPEYGLRYILARHSNKYFVNYKDKNKNTLFPDEFTAKDIVLGLKDFYDNCVDIGLYNRRNERNMVFIGFMKMKKKRVKSLLVVRRETREIVTFYPFNEVREEEIWRELGIEQRKFHYD